LVELSSIVEPYARCEFVREPKFKALQDEWSAAAKRQFADATDKTAAARADKLMNDLRVAKAQIQTECGYERTHQKLRDRLLALHPKMDTSRAYWLARSVFNNLNNLNISVIKLKAGIFPAAPPPPPSVDSSSGLY